MLLLAAFKNTVFVLLLSLVACGRSGTGREPGRAGLLPQQDTALTVAANRTESYFPMLRGRAFALVANQTSVVFRNAGDGGPPWVHLADSLLSAGLGLKKVFAPEHGFRGQVDAGEKVTDGLDPKTGLPVLSLYGANRKPTAQQLEGLDLVLFDIQDVGVRFYTYIATLQLVMEACAEAGIPVVVLDRPNPNAHYVDGPVMEAAHRSFLGMTEIPLVYGMTIGEYARMINEEGWLENGLRAELTVIPLKGYVRGSPRHFPSPPPPTCPMHRPRACTRALGFLRVQRSMREGAPHISSSASGRPFCPRSFLTSAMSPSPGRARGTQSIKGSAATAGTCAP